MDERRNYRTLIADVLFWHSVILDDRGFAVAIVQKPLTLDDLRGTSRLQRVVVARKDVAVVLRGRNTHEPHRWPIFSLKRIGDILGRHHTTILCYLQGKARPPWAETKQQRKRRRQNGDGQGHGNLQHHGRDLRGEPRPSGQPESTRSQPA
jgi:hypothetical protein